jgi:hypothetical protein
MKDYEVGRSKHGACECGEDLEHFTGPNAGAVLCPACDGEHVDELRQLNERGQLDTRGAEIRFSASAKAAYYIGSRWRGALKIDGFDAEEIRDADKIRGHIATAREIFARATASERLQLQGAIAGTDDLAVAIDQYPPIGLLERLEREDRDGFYLYPKSSA